MGCCELPRGVRIWGAGRSFSCSPLIQAWMAAGPPEAGRTPSPPWPVPGILLGLAPREAHKGPQTSSGPGLCLCLGPGARLSLGTESPWHSLWGFVHRPWTSTGRATCAGGGRGPRQLSEPEQPPSLLHVALLSSGPSLYLTLLILPSPLGCKPPLLQGLLPVYIHLFIHLSPSFNTC